MSLGQDEKVCPLCNGEGGGLICYDPYTSVMCPSCEGSGVVQRILPSKELIHAVLGFFPDAMEVGSDGESIDLYELAPEDGSVIGGGNISLHTFIHMMKDWAYDKHDITISSTRRSAQSNVLGSNRHHADSEFEAVTKVCEEILKENK